MKPISAEAARTISGLLVAGALLAGCASLSDADCRAADWYELGERDALFYGLRPQIDQYAHQCSRHGVQPLQNDYMAGWIVGDRERAIRMSGSECCAPN
jgi:hypothetical protein